jgi:hypothetical protein
MTKSCDDRLQELFDKQDIRDCLTRFSRGMDRFDRELYMSAFWEDAEIAAGPYVGSVSGCWDWAIPMHETGQIATQHNLLNITYDIQNDTAHVETYYIFAGRNRDDSNWIAGGRYVDLLERREGEWRIALRTTAIEWSGILPTMDIAFADVPGIHENGPACRGTEDISYRRPLTNRRRSGSGGLSG